MMTARYLCVCLLLVICGFATSFGVTRHVMEAEREATVDSRRQDRENELKRELDGLAQEHVEKMAKLDAKLSAAKKDEAEIAARLKGRKTLITEDNCFMVPMTEIDKFHVPIFIHQPVFRGEAKRFLKMTEEEGAAAQKLFDEIWDQVLALEPKHATVTRDDALLTIEVQPFGQAGKTLQETYYSGMREILGPKRYLVFRIIGRQHYGVDRMFLGFGQFPYRIKFREHGRHWWLDYRTPKGEWKVWLGGTFNLNSRITKRLLKYQPDYFKYAPKK